MTLHERVAGALSESAEAQRALATLPGRRPSAAVVLAALHEAALAGRAPELAAAYAAADADAAARAAIDTLVAMPEIVAAAPPLRAHAAGAHAVLYPLIAEAARRAGAEAVGLIDIGGPAALNLTVARVGITYSDGLALGDPSSPVQVTCTLVGDGRVPARALREVVARIGVARDPLDVTDAGAARWVRACAEPEQGARLAAELALAAADPPLLLAGDVIARLPDAIARVPAGALPVVITTWALSKVPPARRTDFLQALQRAGRTVAWVAAEGVGVAPAVPTLGDRPAFGHSTIGVAVATESALRVEAIGRCWSRGRLLSWLAAREAGPAARRDPVPVSRA
jgi:hypothetical protein